ncbi:CFI-box-CTERM domain-containing protein [Endozoicomonas sp. SCSIO W0465]|uniref:CFI-box-CTERM domain-containing protein n=1 Tax=Endozoicomonas sp. SCSIO W0465 TaxID=2918516 RepID=UPI0020756A0A|nr:CFI-box-CTERM domain-containing protein [Endozoicomonas sp. SCSIO W0465]USE39509.1 hypothetical protein MJO57_15905 [Endozoicomonas sp. SCSIO W0465]
MSDNNPLQKDQSSSSNTNSTEVTQRTQNTDLAPADLLNNAMRNLTQEQVNAISQKATDEALRLQVKQQEQLLDEEAARRETLTHIDTFNDLSKEGRATRHHVKSSMKTGSGTRDIESKSGATCFVATCAFEGQHHPTVQNLRYFRDSTLANYKLGNSFIHWYYKNGPIMAKKLDNMPIFKPFVRYFLNVLVKCLPKPE